LSGRWSQTRPYPAPLPAVEYPGHFLVKKITTGGTFRFHSKVVYLANALTDQHIGLEEVEDGRWAIYFTTVLIATLNERRLYHPCVTPSVTHLLGQPCYLSTLLLTCIAYRQPGSSCLVTSRICSSFSDAASCPDQSWQIAARPSLQLPVPVLCPVGGPRSESSQHLSHLFLPRSSDAEGRAPILPFL